MIDFARRTWLTLTIALLLGGGALAQDASRPAKQRESSVGLPVRLEEVVLPGTELEPKPIEDRDAKLVVRVVSSSPHGTARRYNLEYYGLEPGEYDLRDYLRRKDATSTEDLPPLKVKITTLLPAGQILPNDLKAVSPPWLGGYRILLLLGSLFWLAIFILLLFVGRKRKPTAAFVTARPLSLAERLQPLVETAMVGKLSLEQQAALERMLLGYWSERLGLQDADPALAIQQLRNHPQAGQLLRQIEAWLHQPGGARQVDLTEMLLPYRGAASASSPVEAVIVAEEVRG